MGMRGRCFRQEEGDDDDEDGNPHQRKLEKSGCGSFDRQSLKFQAFWTRNYCFTIVWVSQCECFCENKKIEYRVDIKCLFFETPYAYANQRWVKCFVRGSDHRLPPRNFGKLNLNDAVQSWETINVQDVQKLQPLTISWLKFTKWCQMTVQLKWEIQQRIDMYVQKTCLSHSCGVTFIDYFQAGKTNTGVCYAL